MTGTESKSMSKGTRIFFIGSLALNLFLVAVILSAIVTVHQRFGPFDGPRHGRMGPLSLHSFVRAMPPEANERVREIMNEHRKEIRPKFREMREVREGVFDAIKARPFSREALETALADSRNADAEIAKAIHDAIVDATSTLTDEQRIQLSENIEQRLKERRERWLERRRNREAEQDRRNADRP
jgi:uncharacterized membrane protein